MGNPIQPGNLQFITREYFLEGGDDYAYDQTLSFQQLDTTLIFLSNSIATAGTSFVGLTTASANLNTINFSKSNGTTFSITVDTGSGQTYTAGDGININESNVVSAKLGAGLRIDGSTQIEATVRQVNGQEPNATTGNISTTLTAVETGVSSSLVASSSGVITASIQNGTVWVISGDGDDTKNGDTYIFKSGSIGQWYQISTLDEVAGDARYVRLSATSTQNITSSLRISGSTTFSGSLFWSGASDLGGATNYVLVLDSNGQIYKTGSYGGGGGSGTPGSPFNSIQYNSAGGFAGSSSFTFNGIDTVNLIGTGSVTGSMIISRSIEGIPLTVIGTGSSPILNVVGSTGNLLQAYDRISGDIFTVGDYPSGLPILRVTSNRETFIGNNSAPGLHNSFITSSVNTGNYVVYQILTSSYNALWIDYSAYSGSDFRAGTFNTMWSGSTIRYVDITGSNFGNTNNLTFTSSFSSSYLQVTASIVTTNGWFIKGIIRAI
jgi:hypothetical protein